MSSSCFSTSAANISTTATELTFNGNDAVGLFKNGVLIDIIGTFNGGTSNFAIDVTLRRKSTVTSPSTTFNLSAQWDSYSQDTCNNLASKMVQTAEIEEEKIIDDSNEIVIYPNPSDGNFGIKSGNSDLPYSVEVFSYSGQKVFEKQNTTSPEISIQNLSSGIYIIKVIKGEKIAFKKVIIN
ncbi:T9SS type A sorting domain-containing protein [Flavobacterium ginsenosidimutans]|uniref:T9SS type A sorting domain-containing protein n=1 Tax=Flavobacterium ginsenosidimutans TaxID=687844 RepID=UPI003D96806A